MLIRHRHCALCHVPKKSGACVTLCDRQAAAVHACPKFRNDVANVSPRRPAPTGTGPSAACCGLPQVVRRLHPGRGGERRYPGRGQSHGQRLDGVQKEEPGPTTVFTGPGARRGHHGAMGRKPSVRLLGGPTLAGGSHTRRGAAARASRSPCGKPALYKALADGANALFPIAHGCTPPWTSRADPLERGTGPQCFLRGRTGRQRSRGSSRSLLASSCARRPGHTLPTRGRSGRQHLGASSSPGRTTPARRPPGS